MSLIHAIVADGTTNAGSIEGGLSGGLSSGTGAGLSGDGPEDRPLAERIVIWNLSTGEKFENYRIDHMTIPVTDGDNYKACAFMPEDSAPAKLNLAFVPTAKKGTSPKPVLSMIWSLASLLVFGFSAISAQDVPFHPGCPELIYENTQPGVITLFATAREDFHTPGASYKAGRLVTMKHAWLYRYHEKTLLNTESLESARFLQIPVTQGMKVIGCADTGDIPVKIQLHARVQSPP
ncbi:hypothetical protein MRB53_041749 [Persea americana]|nr:hypothetical protein MRB53_041749 [Persea americana]